MRSSELKRKQENKAKKCGEMDMNAWRSYPAQAVLYCVDTLSERIVLWLHARILARKNRFEFLLIQASRA
jgi:hypothetical protein